MKINLYYNQFANGGAVDVEKWSLIPDEEMEYNTFRSCETLETVEIEIPDKWEINREADMIFDEKGNSVYFMELSDWDKIRVATDKFPYYKTLWKRGK